MGDTTTAPATALGRDVPALLVWIELLELGKVRAVLDVVLVPVERGEGALTLINAMLLLLRLLLRNTEIGVAASGNPAFLSRGVELELHA